MTGVALSRELQVSLTAGVLNLLDIDPGFKSNFTARFSNLTIVQVKDPDKLAGPAGEPRIVEALRAGTITITTDKDMGLDIRTGPAAQNLPVIGRGNTGVGKTWTIDGSDMFIAFRVAKVRATRSPERMASLHLVNGHAEAVLDDFRIVINTGELRACACDARSDEQKAACAAKPVKAQLIKAGSDQSASAEQGGLVVSVNESSPATEFTLPVPRADNQGGLYTKLAVRADLTFIPVTRRPAPAQCVTKLSSKSRVVGQYAGSRSDTLDNPSAPNW